MIIQLPNVKKMIYEAYPALNGIVKAHLEGLENVVSLYTNTVEDFIRRHCEQIYLHLEPEPNNEQQKIVKQRILELCKEIASREIKEEPPLDVLTEDEIPKLLENFEKDTFHKYQNGEKLTIDDYVQFASKYGYSIGKVLIASAWLDEHLTNKAIDAKKEAYEKVTFT
ncbi:MAG: hypothetical protein ACFFA5_06025 [Promethearchaeota archaeon]